MPDDVEYIVHIINYSIFNTAVKQNLDTYINLLGYTKPRYITIYNSILIKQYTVYYSSFDLLGNVTQNLETTHPMALVSPLSLRSELPCSRALTQ